MKYYDFLTPGNRWDLCADFPIEFITAARIMSEHIAQGDKLLDLGGDVGRFALYFADMGCDVTLADTSSSAIEFVNFKAASASTKVRTVLGYVNDVPDNDFDFVIARAYQNDVSAVASSVLSKLKDGGRLALWVMSDAYDLQKLLDFSPDKLTCDFIPDRPENMFVDSDSAAKALSRVGFSIERVFSPFGILTHADSALTALSADAFVKLMDASINMCQNDRVVASSSCLVFICNKNE